MAFVGEAKKQVLTSFKPKRTKFYQKSEIGHVRTCQVLSLWARMGPNPDWAPTQTEEFIGYMVMISMQINEFLSKIGPIWAHKGPMGPYVNLCGSGARGSFIAFIFLLLILYFILRSMIS